MAALAMRSAAPLKPEILLAKSISEFETALPPTLKTRFNDTRRRALSSAPTAEDVTRFTADLNVQIRKSSKLHRCLGTRFTNVLQAVQRYAAIGDVVVGGSQNITACAVWSVVRITIQVCIGLGSYLDKISTFFMTAGQTAPRYESMGHLYRQSTRLSQFLSHYFIVIVQTCRQFVEFSQKSLLGQLASSLDDSKIQDAQSNLDKWAHRIQEEISFLATETVEGEANENGMFRAMVSRNYSWEAHQRKLRLRSQFLEAISSVEHETPYKQARKCGTSTIFQKNDAFNSWKDAMNASTIVLLGKLGSGKSVTMANIVDHLLLSEKRYQVTYFFCRHDNSGSLTARAVIGSLARQLIAKYFDDSLLQHVADGLHTIFSLEDIFRLVKSVVPTDVPIHFILDGIDEMPFHEARETIKALGDLQTYMQLIICGSIRSSVQDATSRFSPLTNISKFLVPEKNVDITSFIDEELKRRIESKQLLLGNEAIVLEIRDALVKGANGMFLWVALQIDGLCEEKTDNAIRRALKDLPPDLFTTFGRILHKSQTAGRSYQPKVLKLIVAAHRPLQVDELREAISVEPGVINWSPGDLINNIYDVLACCGSLILVDEENLSVRLIHQSVTQFLLTNDSPDPRGEITDKHLHFTATDAQKYMGKCAITYLNYSLFETRITKDVAHDVQVGGLPSHIINEVLAPSGIAGQLAMMLLKSGSTTDFDAKRSLVNAVGQGRQAKPAQLSHFLDYASRHWLRHTSWITRESKLYTLWLQLLDNPKFNSLVWTEGSASRDALMVDSETGSIWQFSERVMWAIANSHKPLLKYEIRGRGYWKALSTVVPYLRKCMACRPRISIDASICTQILPLVTMFKSYDLVEWLVSMGAVAPFDPEAGWPGRVSDDDYLIARAIILRNPKQISSFHNWPLLELAVDRGDCRMAQVLSQCQKIISFERVFSMDVREPVVAKMIYHLLSEGSLFSSKGSSAVHRYDWENLRLHLKTLYGIFNANHFQVVGAVLRVASSALPAYEFQGLLCSAMKHYCLCQDSGLVKDLLPWCESRADPKTYASFILAALHSWSPERRAIAKLIWEELVLFRISTCRADWGFSDATPIGMEPWQNDIKKKIVLRCVQLRDWALATVIAGEEWATNCQIPTPPFALEVNRYAKENDLIRYCASVLDYEGIEFLRASGGSHVDSVTDVASPYFRHQAPLDIVFKTHITDWKECNRLTKTATLLLEDEAYKLKQNYPFEAFASLVEDIGNFYKIDGLRREIPTDLEAELPRIMVKMLETTKKIDPKYGEDSAQELLLSLLKQYFLYPNNLEHISSNGGSFQHYHLHVLIRNVLKQNPHANEDILQLIWKYNMAGDDPIQDPLRAWLHTQGVAESAPGTLVPGLGTRAWHAPTPQSGNILKPFIADTSSGKPKTSSVEFEGEFDEDFDEFMIPA